jgi:hypothetical protein
MVETRKTTRRDAQGQSKNSTRMQAPKTNRVAATRHTKRKAIQETVQKGETPAKGKGKKRVKKEHPSYLQRSHETGNGPNRNIQLLNLPRDIFNEITSWLEPDALTCLSLTCKDILSIVGGKSWAECRPKRQYWDQTKRLWTVVFRQSLIPLLGRDAPHLTLCDVCMTLHPPLKPPREHRETKLTKPCFGPWSTIDYLPSDELGRYNLLWEHIVEARKSLTLGSEDNVGSPIELLDGNFTVRYERLNYTLNSSGQQIGKNLVLKHEHIFHGVNLRSPLRVTDIITLPVRLCPHQTTSTQKPQPGRYTKGRLPSGLLTHSISTAAPPSLRAGIPTPSMFNNPAPSETKQMDSVVSGVNGLWTCRACPTKWHVQHSGEGAGELKITAWHSFGDTAYRAQEYWKMLVRREMSNLGDEKRNSEFFVATKQYLDFAIDEY